jgi:hypothetical protein
VAFFPLPLEDEEGVAWSLLALGRAAGDIHSIDQCWDGITS